MIEISNKDAKELTRLLAHLSGLYNSKGSPRNANISRVAFLLHKRITAKLNIQDKPSV
jgi:hypothetical protein